MLNAIKLTRSATRTQALRFSTSAMRSISVGDAIPQVKLFSRSPGTEVDLADRSKSSKYLLVGVPGAFSPGCSQNHVPGFLKQAKELKNKGVERVTVVTVNDAFVAGAWEDNLVEASKFENDGFFEVLADPKGEFTSELGTLFDASAFFGNERSKRFAALVENNKITKTFVEPDNVSVAESSADKVVPEL